MQTDRHILIVEDSPTQAALLDEVLRLRGYRTEIAANGSLALESVRRQRPAVILSDVRMPVMDGLQLCAAIKQDPGLRRIPVFLLTTLTSATDVLSALEAGADFYIPKPYQDDYLAAKITEVLSWCDEDGLGLRETETPAISGTTGHQISTTPEHMLRLLTSTYEVAIQQNLELLKTQEELKTLNETLEDKVRDRTARLTAEINQRMQAEEALTLAKTAAEKANHAKSEFLANMSHELRTPMTAILGFSELLLSAEGFEQEHRQFLESIQNNGKAMTRVVDDILELSRIEAGRLTVNRQGIPVQRIIDDVLNVVSVRAAEKGLSVQVVHASSLPELIHSDPAHLRQILVNLLSNAVKFTEQGEICLTVRYLAQDAPLPRMQFAVSDTGIGIPADRLEDLFQWFTQLDGSVTRPYGGLGIGLAISQRLAQHLDGEIHVASELGRGSTFTLTIPAESPPQAVAEHEPSSKSAPDPNRTLRGRVLLVEDSAINQMVIRQLARKLQLDVEMAGDGHIGCQLTEQSLVDNRPYDLILMDMLMPRMDGYEATRRLRDQGWHRPIVALTACAMAGDREKCLAAGCDEYLSKPISLNGLREVFQQYLP